MKFKKSVWTKIETPKVKQVTVKGEITIHLTTGMKKTIII